jgi:2-methylcitrate dehydratase
LWQKIRTVEDKRWTERYHTSDPSLKAFGGRIVITLADGTVIADEMAVANAHTLGATPWQRADYVRKFRTLTEGVIPVSEAERFLAAVSRLESLTAGELFELTLSLPSGSLAGAAAGIF